VCWANANAAAVVALILAAAPVSTASPPPRASDLLDQEARLRRVVKAVQPAVVLLRWKDPKLAETSGVVFDQSGLVMSHGHHGQESRTEVDVLFPDGRVAPGKLETVFDTYVSDWSIIKLDDPGPWPAAKLLRARTPKQGDRCFHIGYGGVEHIDSPRPLLRVGQVLDLGELGVYADCETVPGDSGGPLFNLDGDIIGIANQPKYWVTPNKTLAENIAFGVRNDNERKELGLLGANRRELDSRRGLSVEPFEALADEARKATVPIYVGDVRVASGLTVRDDGVIVTKRSTVLLRSGKPTGRITCLLADGRRLDAVVVGESHENDVAVLKVNGGMVPAVSLHDGAKRELGTFVAAVTSSGEPLVPGVVSTSDVFSVPPHEGDLGAFSVRVAKGGVVVTLPDWLVKEAESQGESNPLDWYSYGKLQAGDLITHANGVRVNDEDSFRRAAYLEPPGALVAGDLCELTLADGESSRTTTFPAQASYGRALDNWGPPSYRRTGFTEVFSHDALISREQCGGPLINSDGRVIGVNIARFHKHQTLAIPTHRILELVEQLVSTE
jgi:serine protease Do